VRWELLARLCPNTTGAEIRSVCTEAGMFALRDRRKVVSEKDLLIHDEEYRNPTYAFLLAKMEELPDFPTPVGVLRRWEGIPRYEDLVNAQVREVTAKRGAGDIAKLLRSGDTWEVR